MAFTPDQTAPDNGSSALGPQSRSIPVEREHHFAGPNNQIADKLRQASDILAVQEADPFRIAAYRRATDSVRALNDDLGTVAEKGGRKALETAAHDGRLEQIRGFGHRSAAMVRAALAEMLARVRRLSLVRYEEPTVDLLLDVDPEYREKARAGELIKIAPKRFNPKGEAWLPLLHTVRDGWYFTALYSITARARQLGRETDWVVIYFHKDNRAEGQRTVVTEARGEAAERRIVRGREAECRRHYPTRSHPSSRAALRL